MCTLNRAASLARALETLSRCEPPRSSWELLIVDNGCSDATPSTLERFRARFPMRVVREPRRGLSHARNTGVANARGEYLLWMDDDATVPRHWLRRYEAAFDAHPDAAFFGGPIRPRFEGTPPAWLPPSLPLVLHAFAGLEQPDPRGRFDASSPGLPFGANCAIRAAEAREFPFDPRIGPNAASFFLAGEESDVLQRIVGAGGHGIWLDDAPVEHWIDPPRQSIAYLRNYYCGVSFVGTRRALERGDHPVGFTRRLRLWRRIAVQHALYLGNRLLGRRAAWIEALRETSRLRGRLRAHREIRAGRPAAVGAVGGEAA
jgi:glycosyltransferase involved in cell wall biosynthesis